MIALHKLYMRLREFNILSNKSIKALLAKLTLVLCCCQKNTLKRIIRKRKFKNNDLLHLIPVI